MHPDLEKLLDLQSKDLALSGIDDRLTELHREVERLDEAVARARAELETARRSLREGVKRREEIEAKVEGLRVLQDRRRQRLEMAKTSRELQALGSELELARSVLAREEAEWFRAAEAVTTLEAAVERAAATAGELEQTQGDERAALTGRIAEVEAERAQARSARDESAQQLERTILLRYDRLRQNRENAVVVALRGDACGACFTSIPMSRRSQIRTGFLLEGCEVCGVILYAAANGE